ncbi:LPXTG cell wall anchor domain-containing protein [Streptococcus suis]
MNKQKMMSVVTVAGLALSTGVTAFADEDSTIIGGDNPIEIVDSGDSSIIDTTSPTVPIEQPPVIGGDGAVIGGEDSTIVDNPTDTSIIEQPEVDKPEVIPPKTEPIVTDKELVDSSDNAVVDVPKEESDKKTPIPAEPVIPNEITNPVESPVVTDSGTIISTEAGNVVIQAVDGTITTVSPEAVGGKLEEDGTVTVKDSKGDVKRLPNTGQEVLGSLALSGVGLLGLFGTVLTKIKVSLW